MSEQNIFRKVSLDRLSSPEELDQRLTLITPIGWISLSAISLLLFAGIIWGVFGNIPEKAVGQGIIMSSGGIVGVIHHADGQIIDVSINDGDYIQKGQTIARIEQTQIINEINRHKEDLAAAKSIDLENVELNDAQLNFNIYESIGIYYKDYQIAKSAVNTQMAHYNTQKVQAEYELQHAKLKYEETYERFNNYKILYENGAISQSEFKAAERELLEKELAYSVQKQNLNALPLSQLAEAEASLIAQKQWLKNHISFAIKDLDNNIMRLQQELMNNSKIVASTSGRVLEMKVRKGDLVQTGSIVCTIAEEKQHTDVLEVVIYVPVDQGKRIMPGMKANISPTTIKKEEHGFMLGNVVAVSSYPASSQGMMLTLGNEDLVRQLAGDSAPIEVRAKLVMDSSTPSGYSWSTSKGPPMEIDGGTFCIGEIVVAEKRPISMIVPFFKKILPI